MRRTLKPVLCAAGAVAVIVLASACGTERITVPNTPADAELHAGAVLFQQRCSGCHTLSYAGANGSAANVRTAQYNNGPNFNIRCERPVARVLYAIENGGFSGAIMPQNIVVGPDAVEVAKFVSTYAGWAAPKIPGTVPCHSMSVYHLPTPAELAAASSGGNAAGTKTGATQNSAAAGSTAVKP